MFFVCARLLGMLMVSEDDCPSWFSSVPLRSKYTCRRACDSSPWSGKGPASVDFGFSSGSFPRDQSEYVGILRVAERALSGDRLRLEVACAGMFPLIASLIILQQWLACALCLVACLLFICFALIGHRDRLQTVSRMRDERRRARQFHLSLEAYTQAYGKRQVRFTDEGFWKNPTEMRELAHSCVADPNEVAKDNTGDTFARCVAMLLEAYGWEVRLGPRTNDYGIDIVCYDAEGDSRIIMQCKHSEAAGKPEASFARDLAGTKGLFEADRAILVTIGRGRSKQLHDFRDKYDLEYWDVSTLCELASALYERRKSGDNDPPCHPIVLRGFQGNVVETALAA